MIDDPIQYLEGQAHEIELKAIRDLRGGRAGVVRSSIDDKLENVRRTTRTDVAFGSGLLLLATLAGSGVIFLACR